MVAGIEGDFYGSDQRLKASGAMQDALRYARERLKARRFELESGWKPSGWRRG